MDMLSRVKKLRGRAFFTSGLRQVQKRTEATFRLDNGEQTYIIICRMHYNVFPAAEGEHVLLVEQVDTS